MLKGKIIKSGAVHGGMDQKVRLSTIEDFRQNRFRFLVTTDVAARGIDFSNITHVINYDFPTNKDNYIHRIGRTGRNGASGNAISFISREELANFYKTIEYIGVSIQKKEYPTDQAVSDGTLEYRKRQNEKVKPSKSKKDAFKNTIMQIAIGGGKKSKIRPGDIVGAICSIEMLEKEDIGSIDIRESITYVEVLNGKGPCVLDALQNKTIKGKVRKVRRG